MHSICPSTYSLNTIDICKYSPRYAINKFQKLKLNTIFLSETISIGNLYMLTIFLISIQASYFKSVCLIKGIKYTNFISLSMTINILLQYILIAGSSDINSFVIRFIKIDCYSCSGTSSNYSILYGTYCRGFALAQMLHCFSTFCTIYFILGKQYILYNLSRIFLVLGYPYIRQQCICYTSAFYSWSGIWVLLVCSFSGRFLLYFYIPPKSSSSVSI